MRGPPVGMTGSRCIAYHGLVRDGPANYGRICDEYRADPAGVDFSSLISLARAGKLSKRILYRHEG